MTQLTPVRTFFVALALALTLPFAAVRPARADGYLGVMGGLGIPMGTEADVDNGAVYGATLGAHLLPMMSVAVTYLHDNLQTTVGHFDYHVNQYLAELNFFSLLWMNAGLHVGAVNTSVPGASSTDLGFGAHLGFDVHLTPQVSLGAAAYWTYVTADDKYATLNLMIPLKVWF